MSSAYSSWWYRWFHRLAQLAGRCHWNPWRALVNQGIYYDLTEQDHDLLREKLADNFYLILTYRKSHLSTYLVGILSWLKTGIWPTYSHILMNVDDIDSAQAWRSFKLCEATGRGVHWSSFMKVFDCDRVCLMRPRHLTAEQWLVVMEALTKQQGKPYDDIFGLMDDTRLSCVELVRLALKALPSYDQNFWQLEAMIQNVGNLTPQMFRDCPDLEAVVELQR